MKLMKRVERVCWYVGSFKSGSTKRTTWRCRPIKFFRNAADNGRADRYREALQPYWRYRTRCLMLVRPTWGSDASLVPRAPP